MLKYISFGAGVNSVAMTIHLDNIGIDYDEIVFCDTGTERPETYEYLEYFHKNYLEKRNRKLIIISAEQMGLEKGNLLNFFQKYSMIPSRMFRACTERFKVKALHHYFSRPCQQAIGIDAGEAHRAKAFSKDGITSIFPLVEAGITRKECIKIIRDAGLCVPVKSGCYFCAFQRIGQYRDLYQKHPKLFKVVEDLEEAHHQKHNLGKWLNNPENWIFIKEKPMSELALRFKGEIEAEEKQFEFDDIQDSMNCLCKFA